MTFTIVSTSGLHDGDICDLLALAEAGELVDLAKVRHHERHGVVSNLGAFIAVMHHYSTAPLPWSAGVWREEWDRQLGAGSRELRRPLGEPALFQRPISPNTAVEAIDPSDIGASPLGDRHMRKTAPVSDEQFVFGHLASTLRPTNGRSQQATGSRAGVLMVIPTDGTIGSEIMTIANAVTCEGGTCARDHMAWLLPSRQPRATTQICPIIDTTMASRLTEHGIVHGSSGRALDPEGRLDPQIARRIDGQKIGPVKTSPKSPWRWKVLLGALADGVEISKAAVSRAAPILGTLHGQPGVRLVSLGTENGKTTGFREMVLPLRPAAVRQFILAGRGETDQPSKLANRIVDAVATLQARLFSALSELMGRPDRESPLAKIVGDLADRFGTEAGYRGVELFVQLVGEADGDQQKIQQELGVMAVRHFESAASACPDPLRVARASVRIQDEVRSMSESTLPQLARRVWATLQSMRRELSPNDRAQIRGSGMSATPPMPVWRCLSHVGPEELEIPEAERAWRMAVMYLGSADIGRKRAGRALFGAEFPEPRMLALLANRGAGHVEGALEWLRSTETTGVDITPLLALALADAVGDDQARRWAVRTLALDYVRPAGKPAKKGNSTDIEELNGELESI